MRNRAKCKKCDDIIESTHRHEFVSCRCGEISIDGGDAYCRCMAKDWDNFLRIDDDENIIVPKIKEPEQKIEHTKPTREELIKLLDDMIGNIEGLPATAMINPVNHYDYVSGLLLLSALFKSI